MISKNIFLKNTNISTYRLDKKKLAKEKTLNICILSYRSNPFCGGQGIYVKYLSKALKELGHRVDVVSGEPYPELCKGVTLIPLAGMNFYGYNKTTEALKHRGIKSFADLYEFISYTTGGFPEPRAFGIRVKKYLLTKKDKSYDIIHDNQSLSYSLLSINKYFPLVSTIHHPITRDLRFALKHEKDFFLRLLIKRWHNSFLKMQKKVAPLISHIITVSKAAKKDIEKDFNIPKHNIHVIYNGVDFNKFKPIPNIKPISGRIICTSSADVPLKGLNYLIKAIALIKKDFPDIHLRVIGKPKKGGTTEKLIKKLNLEKKISFVSGLSDEEMILEYAKAEIAVAPSLYEGFGLPAAEAMACGKPVIATTGGALPEVVGNAGLLVPPGDPTQLANALNYLLSNPSLQQNLGEKARQRIIEKFNWTFAAIKTIEVYKKAILAHANC